MINPLTGLEEDELNPQPHTPDVKDYIMKKFNLGQYSNDARQKLVDDSKVGFGDKANAALMALGAGIMGKDPAAAGQAKLKSVADAKNAKLDAFDKGRSNLIQEHTLDRQMTTEGREDRDDVFAQEKLSREKDPNSQESKMAYELAQSMGYKGPALTAAQFKDFSPVMQKKYEIEEKRLDRQEARDERRFQAGIKMDEKRQGLKTPFGLANTEDDAKKLKEGFESKQNFDNKLKQMIDLRKSKGGEILDREAVARGKQLSKDLLLEYKNMAKLGVLSQADEDIINAIIPEDPLEFRSMFSAATGQDPTLHRLEKFQEDSDKDFKTRIATRTRSGVETAADGPAKDPDAEKYAQLHNLPYEKALDIITKRKINKVGAR